MSALKSMRMLTRSNIGPAAVTITYDVTYGTFVGSPYKVDLYAPASPARLTIAHFHGGWFNATTTVKETPGNKAMVRRLVHYGTALVADFEIPYVPFVSGNTDTAYRQAIIDASLAAITWLRANAATYNGSTTKIAAWGESTGGSVALMAAAKGVAGGSRPDYVMSHSGVTRLDQFGNDSRVKNYLGISTDPSTGAGQVTAQAFSTYDQWPAGPVCPVYLIHDTGDPGIAIAQARDMATRITAQGGTVTKVELSKGIHADFCGEPEYLTAFRACQVAMG